MLIAICDDEQIYIDYLLQTIKHWKAANDTVSIITHVYHSAEELMIGKMDLEDYDLFFLDLVLPNMNGVDLAKIVRKSNPFCTIVFTTNYDKYLEDGYEISIYRYLRKPLTEDKIKTCLDYARTQSLYAAKSILFKVDGETRRIEMNTIKYMNAGIHVIMVHTISDTITASYRSSIDTFYEELNTPHFIRCHRGYIVNMLYVDRFTSSAIYLLGDDTPIPIGRKYHDDTIMKLKQYFKNDFT